MEKLEQNVVVETEPEVTPTEPKVEEKIEAPVEKKPENLSNMLKKRLDRYSTPESKEEPVDVKKEDTDPSGSETEQKPNNFIPFEKRSKEDLINEIKKFQSIGNKRFSEIEKLNSKVTQLETSADKKYIDFINDVKTDFLGGYEKHASELGLPAVSYLKEQLKETNSIGRVKQWQDTELVPKIEKQFSIEPGTFVPDPSEMYKSGTPSYQYRVETERKENALASENAKNIELRQKQIESITKQRENDLTYLEKTFFEGNKETFESKIKEFDSLPVKIAKGELTMDNSPFAIKNIFRGVFFDELVQSKVNSEIDKVHKSYNSIGLFLPAKDMPADVTNLNGENKKTVPQDSNTFNRQRKVFGKYLNS